MSNAELIKRYDYKLVTWDEFEGAKDKPDGLLERAKSAYGDVADKQGTWVAYDPCDEANEGFLFVSNSKREVTRELVKHIEEFYSL